MPTLRSPLGQLGNLLLDMRRIGIVVRSDRNEHIDKHREGALEVVGFLVSKEVADHDDGQDEHDGVEELEVEAHVDAQAPAHDDDEGRVEQGRLDAGA